MVQLLTTSLQSEDTLVNDAIMPTTSTQTSQDQRTEELRQTLEEAIAHRGRYYSDFTSFSIRFEADDTSAYRDTEHLQSILRLLGLPAALEIVIGANDKQTVWTVNGHVKDISSVVRNNKGRTLVIGHYAGHGEENLDQGLVFAAKPGSKQTFRFDWVLEGPLTDSNAFPNSDVLLILDSCYSGIATRNTTPTSQSVEIVAAVGDTQKALGNRSDIGGIQNRTFTSKLANLIAIQVGRPENSSVSFADLISELRRVGQPDRLPEYRLRVGKVGIRVPILGRASIPLHMRVHSSSSSTQAQRRAESSSSSQNTNQSLSIPFPTADEEYTAVFKAHISDADANSGEVGKLIEWIHALYPGVGLEIAGVYQTRSTTIIFHTPWSLWAKLAGLPGFSLICEAFGRNRISEINSAIEQQMQHQLVVKKENVAPITGKPDSSKSAGEESQDRKEG